MREHWPSLLVNVDFLGQCFGTCPGCLLTTDERRESLPFLTRATVSAHFQSLRKTLPVEVLDYSALAFGRGNTLALSDSAWADIAALSDEFRLLFKPESFTLECSTGLVGKIDFLIEQAQKRVLQIGTPLRFVVAANSDLFSPSYWKNVDSFFERMMAFRGGSRQDGSGDVLALNLVADRLPNPSELLARIEDYPFPVNVAWLPASDPRVLPSLRPWLQQFTHGLAHRGFDSNLVRFLDSLSHEPPALPEALHTLYENAQRFHWISSNGVQSGLFSPFGDVDFHRLSQKSGMPMPSTGSIAMHRLLRQRQSCRGCLHLNSCLSSGVAGLAVMSIDSSDCPVGLRDSTSRVFAE